MSNVLSGPFEGFFDDDVYDVLALLRKEHPVVPLALLDGRTGWLINRYDEVRQALSDPRLVKDGLLSPVGYRPDVPADIDEATRHHMLVVNPPEHGRLRRAVRDAFTPKAIRELAGP